MRRLRVAGVALVALVASCKSSRETTCDQLAQMGTAFANELGKRVGGQDDLGENGEIKAKMAELKAECMKWPDEVFDCMRDNDETSPKCQAAMQHVTGRVATDVVKAPPGPDVVATAMVGEVAWDGMKLSLREDGTIVALISEGLVSYGPTGTSKWRVLLEHSGWMLVDGDLVLAGDRGEDDIVALDIETGAIQWRAAVPRMDELSSPSTEGGVRVGAAVYVPIDDGRVFRVDPAACARKTPGCLELAFTMANEEFDNPQLFALGDDIVFAESTALRRISTSGEVKGYIHVREDLGGATLAGEQRVAAVFDDELVVIDFARCGSTGIALRRKRGRMYLRGEGECDDCVSPPRGCVARVEIDDMDSITPTALRDGSVVASNWDGPVRASALGKKVWASEADSVGPIRQAGDALVFLSRDEEAKPLRVAALDPQTGKAKWSTPLVGVASKDLTSSLEATVETNDTWIVVGVKGHLAWLKAK